jgi:hypothetical protein
MSEQTSPRLRHRGHDALIALLAVLASAVLVLWAWNTIAVELFQAAKIGFKHALAFEAAIVSAIVAPVLIARRLLSRAANAAR